MGNVIGKFLQGLMGPRVAVTITYPDPYEPPLLDPPEALPTSEPATAQIEKEVTADMLPVITPPGISYVLTAKLYAGGQNADVAARTVYFRILRNGVSVATGGQSVAAGLYYTWSCFGFSSIAPGDVLACKLWASGANVTWDYRAVAIDITRPGPSKRMAVIDVAFGIAASRYPQLVQGTPTEVGWGGFAPYHDQEKLAPITASKSLKLLLSSTNYRLGRTNYTDENNGNFCQTHATSRPRYYSDWVLSGLSFRPLNFRL